MGKIADRIASKRSATIKVEMPREAQPEGWVDTDGYVPVVCKNPTEVTNLASMCLANQWPMCLGSELVNLVWVGEAIQKALTQYKIDLDAGLLPAPSEDHSVLYAMTSSGIKVDMRIMTK